MDAFLEFRPRSTTLLILHGDNGVVSICLPEGRMLGNSHWRFAFRHSAALALRRHEYLFNVGPIERNLFQQSAVVNGWNSWFKLVGGTTFASLQHEPKRAPVSGDRRSRGLWAKVRSLTGLEGAAAMSVSCTVPTRGSATCSLP